MAKYVFEAKAANGKDIRGEIDAVNEAEARVKLRAQRMIPVRVVASQGQKAANNGGGFFAAKVKPKDLQIMTRQLSTLLVSGIPILQALETLSEGGRSPALSGALRKVGASVSNGKKFGDSLGEHPLIFNRFYVNMVRAGEESGNIDQILSKLASYIEKSVKLTGKVKGALTYPAVILVIAMLVVSGLLIFIIPKFQALFASFGGELPALTKFVVQMSDILVHYWYIIFGTIGVLFFALKTYIATEDGKRMFDSIAIDLPLFGDLIQKSAVARFTGTLSILLNSGVGIMEAMDIASKTVGNYIIERAIIRARDAITEGKSLTVPLAKEKYIPHMVTQMIGVGEQTGTLDQMLGRIADFYEDEVDVAVSALTSIIEPIMMVVLGSIVAFIVIAMYLPIFGLAGQIGN
jgi:type IV pilus assembly protein PilC